MKLKARKSPGITASRRIPRLTSSAIGMSCTKTIASNGTSTKLMIRARMTKVRSRNTAAIWRNVTCNVIDIIEKTMKIIRKILSVGHNPVPI